MLVDCAAYREGRRCTDDLSLDQVRGWLDQPDVLVWLGLRMPSAAELGEVCARFGLDDFEIDEALAPHRRPTLSIRDDLAWLVLRTVRYDETSHNVALGELSVLVGTNFVITIRHGQASPLTGLRRTLEADVDLLADGAIGVLAAIIHQVVEDHRPALDRFELDAVTVEREVFSESRVQPSRRLYELKREVRELFLAIEPLDESLARLVHRLGSTASDGAVAEIQDASELAGANVERLRTLSDLLNAALDANLTQVSLQQNADMRRISAWVAIAAVPTMIAGVYGMNFDTMPELRWRYGYPLVVLVMVAACATLYRAFKRSGWL